MITNLAVSIALLCSYLTGASALECREFVRTCAVSKADAPRKKCERDARRQNDQCRQAVGRTKAEVVGERFVFMTKIVVTAVPYSTEWLEWVCNPMPCFTGPADIYIDDCFKEYRKDHTT